MLYQTDICSLLISAAGPRSEAPWWEAVNQLPVWSNYVCSFVINAFICIQLFFRSHDYRQKAIALSLFVCDLYAKALHEGGSEGSTIVRRAKCRRTHSVQKINYNKKNWTGFFLFTITPNQFLRYSYKTRYASTKIEASKLGSLSQFFCHGIYMRC